MIEKFKNFLYDISDMILSLLIIALIFYAVSWKISDTLSPDMEQSKKEIVKTENQPPKATELPKVETPAPTPTPVETETPKETETPATSDTDPAKKEDAKDTKPPATPGEMLTFTIAPGSSGYAIGESLQEKGFIENVDDFTKRIIELGVDNQLKAGDFKLAKGDTLDTVIHILIGKGR